MALLYETTYRSLVRGVKPIDWSKIPPVLVPYLKSRYPTYIGVEEV